MEITTDLPEDNNSIEEKKRKTRNLSVLEAGVYSVSDGFGVKNVAPYALALNASNSLMGLLTSVSSLLGNFSQLITLKLLNKYSRKKVVVYSVLLQSLFWLILLIPGILFLKHTSNSNIPVVLLIAIYTSLIISGAIASPAWNSWMKDLVPSESIGRYFAMRSRIAGVVSFIFMIIGGLILDYFKRMEVLYGFFILFIFSFIARGTSGILFTKHYEPEYKHEKKSHFSFSQFVSNMLFNNFGRFVLFIALLNFVVAIASPFFVVYLIKDRLLSYTTYMTTIMASSIATILTMAFWGRFSDKNGSVKTMKITMVFIILVPFLYIFSSKILDMKILLILVIFTEVLSGIFWGGFNLSVSNFLFRSVSREKISYCSAYMNILNGIGVFFGATLGGLLGSLNFWNPLLLIFLISGLGRLTVYILFLPKIRERTEEKYSYHRRGFISNFMINPRSFNFTEGIVFFKHRQKERKLLRFFNSLKS